MSDDGADTFNGVPVAIGGNATITGKTVTLTEQQLHLIQLTQLLQID